MKKSVIWLLAVLSLLAVSCVKEQVEEIDALPGDMPSITATYPVGVETKVSLSDNKVVWDKGDAVSVFNRNEVNQKYTLSGDGGSPTASFVHASGSNGQLQNYPYVCGVYPYSEGNSYNGKYILAEFLAEQSYKENSFDPEANLMVAVSKSLKLSFKYMGGFILVQLYGEGAKVSKVEVKGNDGEILAGPVSVRAKIGDVSEIKLTPGKGTKTLTLSAEEAVAISADEDNPTAFWLVVPPTVFGKGLTVTVTDAEGNAQSFAIEDKVEIGSKDVYSIGPIHIDGGEGGASFEKEVEWTYDLDSEIDHNFYYGVGESYDYSRKAMALGIDPSVVEKYGSEISSATPDGITVKVVDDESGEAVEVESVKFSNIILQGDDLVADFEGFEWDKTYQVEALYTLGSGEFALSGTLTTVDRNRERVTLSDVLEYTFVIKKYDEATGFGYIKKTPVEDSYYYWESDPVKADIYDAFLLAGIIKADDFADAEAFASAELVDKIMNADPAGSADGYVMVNKSSLVLYTVPSFKEDVLKGEDFNSGKQDTSDPNLFVGNEVDRMVTTYIGQEVRIPVKFSYRSGEKASFETKVEWTYALDAKTDHNVYYEAGEPYYSHKAMALGVDEAIVDKYGAEISATSPDAITVKVVDDESGEAVEAEGVKVSNIILKDGVLVADFEGFEWDKTYQVEALYTLGSGEFALSGTLTTVDRNREMLTLSKPLEYTFEINRYDAPTGLGYIENSPVENSYYYWKSDPVTADIYDAFLLGGIIKTGDFAGANAFATAELIDKVMMADPAGSADGYVMVNKSSLVLYTISTFKASVLKGETFSSGKQDDSDPYLFVGNEVDRMITTYIGQTVRIPVKFNYRVPEYDFLAQSNYTFDDGKWYSMASPRYYLNKACLESYDANLMNVPALAFNIIDSEKRFFDYLDETVADDDPNYFYDKNLLARFAYSGPDTEDGTALESQCSTGTLTTYGDLWSDPDPSEVREYKHFKHSVFYYRSIRDAIPMYGTLEVASGDTTFEIPTSFEAGNGGKYLAGKDYSNFELRCWKPFQEMTLAKDTYTITLDEHTTYKVALADVTGLTLKDKRQIVHGFSSHYVFVDNDWVIGNVMPSASSSAEDNGFRSGVSARQAYGITPVATADIPVELRKIMGLKYSSDGVSFEDAQDSDGSLMPYFVVDYTSEVEFRGKLSIPVTISFENPWQDVSVECTIIVQGVL